MTNQATANLAIGIKTEGAKKDLADLKKWLATEMRSIAVSIDPTSLETSISRVISNKRFRVSINTKELAAEVANDVSTKLNRAVSDVLGLKRDVGYNHDKLVGGIKAAIDGNFGQKDRVLQFDRAFLKTSIATLLEDTLGRFHKVGVDTEHLRAQLLSAVSGINLEMGAAGARGAVSATADGAALARALAPELASMIRASLTPAVDELVKAASVIGGTARKAGGGGGGAGTGEPTARVGKSFTTPDGDRYSYSSPVPYMTASTAIESGLSDKMSSDLQAQSSRDTFRARTNWAKAEARERAQAEREEAQAEVQAAREALAVARETYRSRTNWAKAEAKERTQAEREAAQAEAQAAREALAIAVDTYRARTNWAKAEAREQAAAEREAAQAQAEAEREALAISRETFRARTNWAKAEARERAQAEREEAQAEVQAAREALAVARETYRSRTNWAKAEAKERTQVEREAAQAEAQAAREALAIAVDTYRARTNWAKAEAREQAAAEREAAQAQAEAEREALAVSRETYRARTNWARAEARERTQAEREAAQAQAEAEREALAISRETFRARTNWARAEARDQAEATKQAAAQQRLAMASAYEDAKLAAKQNYTGDGVRIAAAQALKGQFGDAATRDFLGPKAGLVDAIGQLEQFRRGASNAGAQGHAFRGVLSEMHDGARGLAGSLGALWLTWGSIIPLAAGAALGAAFREVVTSGKDVEYQLRAVSELTGGTAMGVQQLNDAMKGSMVAPEEAAKGLRGLAQNGLSATEALMALPDILNLATVGEMSLSEASLGATGVMAAFNLQVSDLGRIGDVFAKAAAMSNTSVSSMVEAMKQASQVGDQYHVTLEEAAGSLAVLAKRNIEGTAAGTALRNMISSLASPSKKASQALKEMHVELYDATTHQLKPYMEILTQVRQATMGLNEQGKNRFLEEVFTERGAKAVNSLLADFDQLKASTRTLKEESEGFSRNFAQGLGDTAEGKLKMLAADFSLVAAKAFEATPSVKNFIDELHGLSTSDSIGNAMKMVTDGFVGTARVLLEHPVMLATVAAGWKAIGIASRVAAAEGAVAAITLEGVVGGLGAALLGPVGLVAALGIAFVTLARHETDAEEKYDGYISSLKRSNTAMDDNIERLERQIDLLRKKNELMGHGTSAEDAQRIAEGAIETVEQKKQREATEGFKRELADLHKTYDQLSKPTGSPRQDEANGMKLVGIQAKIDAANKKVSDAEALLATMQTKRETEQNDEYTNSQLGQRDQLLQWFAKYEKDARELRARTGKDHVELTMPPDDYRNARRYSNDDLETLKSQLDADRNKKAAGFTVPDHHAESEADKLQRAQTAAVIAGIHERESAMRDEMRLQHELDKARFDPAIFGPYMASVLADQDAMRDSEDLLDNERQMYTLLAIEKSKAKNDVERTNIQKEIDAREANITRMTRELAVRKEVAKWTAIRHDESEDRKNSKYDAEMQLGSNQRIAAIDQKYSTKIVSPVEAARSAASMAAMNAYAKGIADEEERIKGYQEGRSELYAQLMTASESEIPAIWEKITGTDALITKEQALLAGRKANAEQAAKTEGDEAARQQAQSETWKYGMQKYWAEFQSQATNTAKLVEDVMGSTYGHLEQAMDNFVMTGKLNFKSLVSSMAADAAKLLANAALRQILTLAGNAAINFFSGYTPGGSAASNSADNIDAGGGWSPATSANGNILTSDGPLTLSRYAGGGIARTPQLSVFGEGRLPEAYVPLPDGRSIPVTMQGGGGGGGSSTVNISVNVQTDGSSRVTSDASGEKAAQLGKMVEQAVTSIIVREKRVGGLLAKES